MAYNGNAISDLSVVLNAIVKQATGQGNLAATDLSNIVSVGETVLRNGYDPVIQAISQVLTKTIFSARPYNAQLGSLMVDEARWGNHVRKINFVDKEWEKDESIPLTENGTVDHYKVNNAKVVQTNFYGQKTRQKHITIYKHQLDSAFESAQQFGSFISAYMQNSLDVIEQASEEMRRSTLVNLIAATSADPNRTIHLLTEYNKYLGLEDDAALTVETVRSPENYPGFVKFMYTRIKNISDLMTARSVEFHKNPAAGNIQRHTPYDKQKVFFLSSFMNSVFNEVFSSLYNDKYMSAIDFSPVAFWQNISDPGAINVTPAVLGEDGQGKQGSAFNNANVLGIIMDEEAAGVSRCNEWSQATPMNAAGGYYNQYWHFTDRYWNDETENAVIFLLD